MNVTKLQNGIWNIAPGTMSSAYLVEGETGALMIDSSAGAVDVLAAARSVTDKPIRLVLTHYHADHTGGSSSFTELYAHPKDLKRIMDTPQVKHPVVQGSVFDLGGRKLRVIELPGHTPGSIGLYDAENSVVFTGDMLSSYPVFFIEGERDADAYIDSMDRLLALPVYRFYGAHGPSLNTRETVRQLKDAAQLFKAGALDPRPAAAPMSGSLYLNKAGFGFVVPAKG